MHSSRMRTVRCRGRLGGGGGGGRGGGGVCMGGCLPMGVYTSPQLWTERWMLVKT